MARHGENIRKRQDGRWEGRYLTYSEEKNRRLYRSVYGKSYEEVREKLTIKKKFLEEGTEKESTDKSREGGSLCESFAFSRAANEWFIKLWQERKPSTCVKYHFIYETYLKQPFEDCTISQITEVFVHEALPGPFSDSVQKSIYSVLNQILKFARERYKITAPPVSRPVYRMPGKPVETLNRKEQSSLLTILYCQTDCSKAAILICLYTGLRLGEICALKWTDVDLENKLITVNRTVQRLAISTCREKTTLQETEPKSRYSRREIPLSDYAWKLFSELPCDQEYVFGGEKPMEPRTMQYRFKKYLKEAGLPKKNYHILRHTFATNCIEGGADVKSLSEILGHSDVRITLNRYVHPTMDTKRKHLDGLALFYGQIRGQING